MAALNQGELAEHFASESAITASIDTYFDLSLYVHFPSFLSLQQVFVQCRDRKSREQSDTKTTHLKQAFISITGFTRTHQVIFDLEHVSAN